METICAWSLTDQVGQSEMYLSLLEVCYSSEKP